MQTLWSKTVANLLRSITHPGFPIRDNNGIARRWKHLGRLDDRCARACRRNVDHGGVRAGRFLGFADGGEDRELGRAVETGRPGLAALLRVHAGDHLGAVIFERLIGVERAGIAGQALHDDFGIGVDKDGHSVLPTS